MVDTVDDQIYSNLPSSAFVRHSPSSDTLYSSPPAYSSPPVVGANTLLKSRTNRLTASVNSGTRSLYSVVPLIDTGDTVDPEPSSPKQNFYLPPPYYLGAKQGQVPLYSVVPLPAAMDSNSVNIPESRTDPNIYSKPPSSLYAVVPISSVNDDTVYSNPPVEEPSYPVNIPQYIGSKAGHQVLYAVVPIPQTRGAPGLDRYSSYPSARLAGGYSGAELYSSPPSVRLAGGNSGAELYSSPPSARLAGGYSGAELYSSPPLARLAGGNSGAELYSSPPLARLADGNSARKSVLQRNVSKGSPQETIYSQPPF